MSYHEYQTVLKWFDAKKGYGFLDTKDDDLGDIFIHIEVLQKGGLKEAPKPNTPVLVKAMKLGKKLRATEVVSVG